MTTSNLVSEMRVIEKYFTHVLSVLSQRTEDAYTRFRNLITTLSIYVYQMPNTRVLPIQVRVKVPLAEIPIPQVPTELASAWSASPKVGRRVERRMVTNCGRIASLDLPFAFLPPHFRMSIAPGKLSGYCTEFRIFIAAKVDMNIPSPLKTRERNNVDE